MLIRIATDSDAKKWDHFVSHHPNSSPYHRFGWKKAIEKSYSHKCFYLIAEDDSNEIVGVLPSVLIKPPIAPGQLCSLPFCDRGEAISEDSEIEQALIDRAQEIAITNQVRYEYRSSLLPGDVQNGVLNDSDKVRMLLSLPDNSEALLSGFKSKLRSQIKKAEKNDLDYEVGRDSKLIEDFYHVFTINMRDLGSPTHSKKWFQQIRHNYQDNMIISIVRYKEQAIGAGIVLFNGEVAAIPWASTLRKYNRLSPNMLLYWSLLQYSSDNGYKIFDFGRSSFGEGTYRFKQQWGAQPLLLNWRTYLKKKAQPQVALSPVKGNIRSSIETVWSRLPLPMTIQLGSRIRKYISL